MLEAVSFVGNVRIPPAERQLCPALPLTTHFQSRTRPCCLSILRVAGIGSAVIDRCVGVIESGMSQAGNSASTGRPGSVFEVFLTFLKLGLTSFGGPIAHVGYFRNELVGKRKWVTESQYSQLIAICQFLPGPASSQLGYSLGLLRAGWAGAIAAFIAFTLPSALLLVGFAIFLPAIYGTIGESAIHGLKLVAVVVVAQGVMGMSRNLCPDPRRASIAALVAAGLVLISSGFAQVGAVVFGAIAGVFLCREAKPTVKEFLVVTYGTNVGWSLVSVFLLLLIALPIFTHGSEGLAAVGAAFYRAGALVFGGGHVVLPLLEESVVGPGWVSQEQFLAGYGAAQAVPGPMFSIAAFLGASLPGGVGGGWGAAVAVIGIFLPGLLLVTGCLPIWNSIVRRPLAARAIAGVNAAVVGMLGAALYDPVWTSAIRTPTDFAIALIGFVLLVVWRISALLVVGWCVAANLLAAVTFG